MQVSDLGRCTHRKDPLYPWKLAGSWSWSEHFGEEKISCPAWFQALDHPACSLVIILITPSHSENRLMCTIILFYPAWTQWGTYLGCCSQRDRAWNSG